MCKTTRRLASPVAVCIAIRGRYTRLAWLANAKPNPNPASRVVLLRYFTRSNFRVRVSVRVRVSNVVSSVCKKLEIIWANKRTSIIRVPIQLAVYRHFHVNITHHPLKTDLPCCAFSLNQPIRCHYATCNIVQSHGLFAIAKLLVYLCSLFQTSDHR